MSAERKIVLESYGPEKSCNVIWKIRHFSLFEAREQAPLKSNQFSANEEVWQLGMYQAVHGEQWCILFNITLCSESLRSVAIGNGNYQCWYVPIPEVYFELSIRIKGQNYLKKMTRCSLTRGKVAKLSRWTLIRQDVLDLLEEHGVEDDVLNLNINIETWRRDTTEMINCLKDKPLQKLNIRMAKMLTNQTLTDVTFNVKHKEFKAHKVVLAASSPVFEAMFKEGTKEHQDNYVNIEDMDSDVFEMFLRFLYSGEVEKLDDMVSDLLAAADKYDVQPLREICIKQMAKNISADNAVDMLALAHRHSIDSIISVASEYLRKNFVDVTRTDSWTSLFDNYVAKK